MTSSNEQSTGPDAALLAVDLGLRTGFAVYDGAGQLRSYGSHNFGSRERLRRGAESVLRQVGPVRWLVVEGDAALAQIWDRAGQRRGATCLRVPAERWRALLLHPSEQRNGAQAKRHADRLARLVIEHAGSTRPTNLRHDAAEAILAGLWGCLEVGLLDAVPAPLRLQAR